MSTLGCVKGVLRNSTALSDRELEAIIKDVRSRKREADKLTGLTQTQLKVLDIANRKAERLRMEAAVQKRNSANNMIKQRGLLDKRAQYRSISEWAEAMADPSNRKLPGARDSATAKQEEYIGGYLSGFVYDMDKAGVLPYLRTRIRDVLNPKAWGKGIMDDDAATELWELREGGNPGSTKNKTAQKIAQIINKWQEVARADLNRLGAFIGKVPGYIVSQSHDMVKIHNAGFDKWYNKILPRLDHDRTFENLVLTGDPVADKQKKLEFLQIIYRQLSQGIFLSSQEKSGFSGPSNVAKKVSEQRVLHFKDAKSWIEYNDEFGTSSLMEAVVGGFRKSGMAAGLMDKFGTNPDAMFWGMIDQAADYDLRNGLQVDKRIADGAYTSKLWDVVTGKADIPASISMTHIGAGLRAWQSLAKLGMAVMSSLGDIPVAASLLTNDFGVNMFGATLKHIGNMMSQFGDDGLRREFAMLMHVGIDGITSDIGMRITGHESSNLKIVHKANTAFFKLNLLSAWTDGGERALSWQMGAKLAALRGNEFDKLPDSIRSVLATYGIEQKEWDVIRKNALFKVRGKYDLLAPDKLRNMPLKEVDALIEWPLEAMAIQAQEGLSRLQDKAKRVGEKVGRLMDTLRQQGEIGQQIADTDAFSQFIKDLQAKDFEKIKAGFSGPIEKMANAVARFAKRDLKIMDQHKAKIDELTRKASTGLKQRPEVVSALTDASADLVELQKAFATAANDLLTGRPEDVTKAAKLKARADRMQERISNLQRVLQGTDNPAQTIEDLKAMSDYVKTLQSNDFKTLVEKHRGDIVGSVAKSVAKFAREDQKILDQHKKTLKGLKDKLAVSKRAEPAVIEKLNELAALHDELQKAIDEWPNNLDKSLDRRRELAVQELSTKLGQYYVDRTHVGVVRAGAREKTYATQATRPGTPEGEAARFVMQFKQYPMAFLQRVLGRYAEEDKFFSIPKALGQRVMQDPGGVGSQVAQLIVLMTVFGYMSMVLKDIAKGRTPRDPKDPRTWGAAFIQGGGAGIYGDYLFARVNRFGDTIGEQLLGPTVGSLAKGADLALGSRDAALSDIFGNGEDQYPDAQAFKYFKDNTPFLNLFYTRSALDYLILYDVQEKLRPGSLRRTERNLKKDSKQEFMLPPSQNRMRPFTGN
jgi:hypothetical protein